MGRRRIRGAASRILAGRRRRVGAAAGAIALGAAAIGVLIGTTSPSSTRAAGNAGAPQGSTTVQRRNLVATDTESGTLSYANPQTVFNRLSGTITWLPAAGRVIKAGQTLYDVDNAPVVLFNGTTPAFRDLSAADTAGPDILELNRDLRAMGFDTSDQITLNDTWQAATTAAVQRWQGSIGATQSGSIALGEIVFLPGSQRVTAIDTVLGSTGGASGSGSSASGASTTVRPSSEFVSYSPCPSPTTTSTTTTPTPTTTTPATTTTPSSCGTAKGKTKGSKSSSAANSAYLRALTALLRAEAAELRSKGATAGKSASSGAGSSKGGGAAAAGSAGSSGAAGSAGSGGASATAIMQTSSTQLVVTVELDASKQSEAVLGAPVTVQMPAGNTVKGKITAVSPVAQSSSSSSSGSGSGGGSGSGSSGSSSTVPVTVTLATRVRSAGLDQAAVSVSFEQQVENNVLSVPVTALLATQGGGYAVQEAAAPNKLIPVTPGLFAAGYVQISGAGIYDGLAVTDSQG